MYMCIQWGGISTSYIPADRMYQTTPLHYISPSAEVMRWSAFHTSDNLVTLIGWAEFTASLKHPGMLVDAIPHITMLPWSAKDVNMRYS